MVRPPPGPSRVHTVPARHTARRIAPSQARATSTLPAAHDTHNHAALRRPCERLAALLHSCSSGASTKSSDSFELLQAPAPSHGKVCDVGTWEGGWDGLASAVLVRLPSVQSARLQRSSSGAPLAHPALDSPACASRSCPFSDLHAAPARAAFENRAPWLDGESHASSNHGARSARTDSPRPAVQEQGRV